MVEKKTFSFNYKSYPSMEALPTLDQELLKVAIEAAKQAYAPYSKFNVGSALRLSNGKVVIGSNQENAAYPSGLCAERVALFAASSQHPGVCINDIAIFAEQAMGTDIQVSPCGACRQVMQEYEQKQGKPMRLLLVNSNREIWEFEKVQLLLPISFEFNHRKKQSETN